MSLSICAMFYTAFLPIIIGFLIGSLPGSGAAYLALLLSTFVGSVVLSLVLCACDRFAHRSRVFSWSRLLVPPLSRTVLFRDGSLKLEWASISTSFFPKSLVACIFSHLKTALFLPCWNRGRP